LLAVADPLFERPDAPPPPLPPGGVLLTMVVPGANAAQAGLKPGDVLLRYDREGSLCARYSRSRL
jgi:hypothetical protein